MARGWKFDGEDVKYTTDEWRRKVNSDQRLTSNCKAMAHRIKPGACSQPYKLDLVRSGQREADIKDGRCTIPNLNYLYLKKVGYNM